MSEQVPSAKKDFTALKNWFIFLVAIMQCYQKEETKKPLLIYKEIDDFSHNLSEEDRIRYRPLIEKAIYMTTHKEASRLISKVAHAFAEEACKFLEEDIEHFFAETKCEMEIRKAMQRIAFD